MPGQLDWMKRLQERRRALFAELHRTADPVERQILNGKLKELDGEIAEWGRQIVRDAESGDPEAKLVLDEIESWEDDEEPEAD